MRVEISKLKIVSHKVTRVWAAFQAFLMRFYGQLVRNLKRRSVASILMIGLSATKVLMCRQRDRRVERYAQAEEKDSDLVSATMDTDSGTESNFKFSLRVESETSENIFECDVSRLASPGPEMVFCTISCLESK